MFSSTCMSWIFSFLIFWAWFTFNISFSSSFCFCNGPNLPFMIFSFSVLSFILFSLPLISFSLIDLILIWFLSSFLYSIICFSCFLPNSSGLILFSSSLLLILNLLNLPSSFFSDFLSSSSTTFLYDFPIINWLFSLSSFCNIDVIYLSLGLFDL